MILNKVETYNRKSAFAKLKDYCTFSMQEKREGDFIEITEWKNGEGFDVNIASGFERENFKLTHGQFRAMKKMIKNMTKNS